MTNENDAEDVRRGMVELAKSTGMLPNEMILPMNLVEQLNPVLPRASARPGPDVPVPTHLPEDDVDEEPVQHITLRERKRKPPTAQITSTVESLRPRHLWFYIEEMAMDTTMQISKEDMPRLPPHIRYRMSMFFFREQPTLLAGQMYLFWFFENGRSRIFQKIRCEKDGKIGWVKAVTARPGAKGSRVWVEIKEESGKLVSRSSRLLFGREDATWKGM